MASKDFEDFSEDFDSLIEAEGPVEEQPDEIEEEQPQPQPKKKVSQPVAVKKSIPVPVKKPQPVIVEQIEEEEPEDIPVQVQAPRPVAPKRPQPVKQQQPRYVAYKTEKRYGLIDNITGQPVMESQDIETLTLSVLSDILNKLDKIESSL